MRKPVFDGLALYVQYGFIYHSLGIVTERAFRQHNMSLVQSDIFTEHNQTQSTGLCSIMFGCRAQSNKIQWIEFDLFDLLCRV